MAIYMSQQNTKFIQHILTGHPQTLGKAMVLVDQGVDFSVSIYSIKAGWMGKAWQHETMTSTSNMMKAKPGAGENTPVLEAAYHDVAQWFDTLYDNILGTQASSPKPSAYDAYTKDPEVSPEPSPLPPNAPISTGKTTWGPVNPKTKKPIVFDSMAQVAEEGGTVTGTTKPKFKPVPTVCKLSDSKAVGQHVKGTSPGSVYTTIALNQWVKVAARVQGFNISLRVETSGKTPAGIMDKIKTAGIQWHEGYGSLHLEAGDANTLRRVVGAFLYGLNMAFDDQIEAGKEIA